MSENIEIRRISSYQDIFRRVRISNQTFLEGARFAESSRGLAERIKNKDEWIFGAYSSKKELVGFLFGGGFPDKNLAGVGSIGVDPAWRGKGIGSLLLKAIEDKACKEGLEKINLGTPYARAFYEKNGYVCIAEDIKMVKDITQQAIDKPCDVEIHLIDFDCAERLGEEVQDEDEKCSFYYAYFCNYRRYNGMLFTVRREGATAGIILGREHDRNSDFAEVAFYKVMGNGSLADVVKAFEYEISKKGLRYVGFSPPVQSEKEFEELGYTRSDMDFFWTKYRMEKKLSGQDR